MEKLFKTLDEQLDILKSKGLIIEDEDQVKEILLRENYFFINGYRVLLMNSYSDKTFVVGATFHELYSIFLFDRSFRNILFKNFNALIVNPGTITSFPFNVFSIAYFAT